MIAHGRKIVVDGIEWQWRVKYCSHTLEFAGEVWETKIKSRGTDSPMLAVVAKRVGKKEFLKFYVPTDTVITPGLMAKEIREHSSPPKKEG
jgi:hypothetical protein